MPGRNKIARIHILKKEAALTDDQYRALLSGFGVASSTEFDDQAADRFARFLQDYIRRNIYNDMPVPGWGKDKYEYLRGRPGDFAEPQQLRKIEAIWRDVARDTGDKALHKFIERQTGLKKIEWLKKHHVEPVLVALKQMMNSQSNQRRRPHA